MTQVSGSTYAGFHPQAIDRAALRQAAREMLAAPIAIPDALDTRLADDVFGVAVMFEYEGVAHYYPRETMTGVVLDVRTARSGKRQLLIKADKLNLPRWVDLDAVQFPAQKQTAEAEAPAVA